MSLRVTQCAKALVFREGTALQPSPTVSSVPSVFEIRGCSTPGSSQEEPENECPSRLLRRPDALCVRNLLAEKNHFPFVIFPTFRTIIGIWSTNIIFIDDSHSRAMMDVTCE